MTQVQEKFERLNSRSEMEFQFDDYHQQTQQEYLVCSIFYILEIINEKLRRVRNTKHAHIL